MSAPDPSLLRAALARNKRKAGLLALYAVATAAIIGVRFAQYAGAASVFVPIARAAAAGIYLNFALLLLPMLRLTLSSRRWDALRVLFPVHKAHEAHTIAGVAILAFSAVHIAAYAGVVATNSVLFWTLARPGPLVTGLFLTAMLGLLGVGARMRTAGRYDWFYYTHFLSIPIGLVSVAHAPWFLAVIAVSLTLFLLDRGLRLARTTGAARVESIDVEGRDLHLVVRRPTNFGYRSGDYAFLCVPAISRLQWHPFSLINAPSDTGSLSFRIRRYGSWTQALSTVPPGTTVYVDGPFGSPCRDLHGCPRAVIVAAGIGITPFVSFLEEVRGLPSAPFERIHLYWLERDVSSFQAFHALLDGLQTRLGDTLSVELVAASVESASVPRLVRAGPVDWEVEFGRLREAGMSTATVFFCGPKPLSDTLQVTTRRHGLKFRTESF